MRHFLNKYGTYVAIGALVLAALFWFILGRGNAAKPASAFFIDEDTGVESTRPVTDVPPLIGAKNNPSVVKVYKYRVAGSSAVKVGYYFKFTPDMKAKMEDAQVHPEKYGDLTPATGMLVRKPELGPTGWVAAGSGAGQKIQVGDPNEGARETVYP